MTAKTQPSPSFLRRTLRVARTEGARGIARRFTARLRRHFRWVYGYLILQHLEGEAPVLPPVDGLRIERLGPGDRQAIEELAPFFEDIYGPEALLARLVKNEHCYLARVDGRLAGCLWVQYSGPVREFGRVLFELAPGEMYLKDAFVHPDMRGRNIYPMMMVASAREMAAEGKKTAMAFVRWKNRSSINASRKMSARRAGAIGYLRIFGRRFPFFFRYPPRRL